MNPDTLAQVAKAAIAGDSFGRNLANFLDGFYSNPTSEALLKRPPLMNSVIKDGAINDAYLAATAEELARRFNLPGPRWIMDEDRRLRSPWFASQIQSLRAVLLVESPVGFRSRNLFVSANALSRA